VLVQLAVALPVGALLGLCLSMVSSHAFQSDLYRIPLVIDCSTWVFSLGVTTAAAVLTSLVALSWIRRLALVEALRIGE
jgi:putative ABC transport system permease protein